MQSNTLESKAPESNASDDNVTETLHVLKIFSIQTRHHRLLTASEETHLAAAMKERKPQTGISPNKRPSKQAEEINIPVRNHFVLANLRLVFSIAQRYKERGVQLSDLVQEGNFALLDIVPNFDGKRGVKFSTYATPHLRRAMSRAIASQGNALKIPVHHVETLGKFNASIIALERQLGHKPNEKEIASNMGLRVSTVLNLLKVGGYSSSLSEPTTRDGADLKLEDLISSADGWANPAVITERKIVTQTVRERLKILPKQERQVVELKFGINRKNAYTFEQIGRRFGFTKQRAQQIYKLAAEKLRDPSLDLASLL